MAKPTGTITRIEKKETPYVSHCAQLRQQGLLRQLPKCRHYRHDFSDNDYLGLSQHPQLIASAQAAAASMGVGSKASRLISAHQHQTQALEHAIATAKHAPAALVFSTGFQANVAVLSALLNPKVLGTPPLVFADKLNHASMHFACQQVGVKQLRYRHCDLDHLSDWLSKTRSQQQPRFILTESVFGMDGDKIDLPRLIALAKQYNAFLYIDEAHGTGLFGTHGYGLTEDLGNEVDMVMGTFSKALGCQGAYLTCSKTLRRYCVNAAKGFIYSTAPSPVQIATMHSAWDLLPTLREPVKQLLSQAQTLAAQLSTLGFQLGNVQAHILPLLVDSPQEALQIQRFLATRDIRVAAIRPPTVPPNQSRLRIALSLRHTQQDFDALIAGFVAFRHACK